MLAELHSLDCSVLKSVYFMPRPLWFNHSMGFFSDYRVWVLISALLAVEAFRKKDVRYVYSLFLIALSIGASDALSAHVLKPYFERVRPCLGDCISTLRWACGSQFSFPSNHATNAAAMVTVSLFFVPSRRFQIFFMVLACIIGFSRVFFGVHYPGDVLGGFIFGGTIAGGICLFVKYILQTRRVEVQS